MSIRYLALLLTVNPATACASDRIGNDRECTRYQFEGGASAYIRPSFVGTLSGRLEAGAPKGLLSMALAVPGADLSKLPAGFTSAKVSAFFRPLRTSEAECEVPAATELVECYGLLSIGTSQRMQLLVTFDLTKDHLANLPESTSRVATYLERTAFACGTGSIAFAPQGNDYFGSTDLSRWREMEAALAKP